MKHEHRYLDQKGEKPYKHKIELNKEITPKIIKKKDNQQNQITPNRRAVITIDHTNGEIRSGFILFGLMLTVVRLF